MTEHDAILKTQERVRPPKKDPMTREWVVKWQEGNRWVYKTFIHDDAAWVWFYTCLSRIKQEYMTKPRER